MKEPTIFLMRDGDNLKTPVKLSYLCRNDVFVRSDEPMETFRVVKGFIPVAGEWFGEGDDPGGYIRAVRVITL